MNYFDTLSVVEDTATVELGLTASEIAASMVPVLIGMMLVGLIAMLMLL